MCTYLITGGAGFIGSSLAEKILAKGDSVYIVDNLSTGFKDNTPVGVRFFSVDISNLDELLALDIREDIDCIYHLAAQSSGEASFDNPVRDMEINYKGTYNVLRLGQAKNCRRFIYASSMSVYGEVPMSHSPVKEDYPANPSSYYGCNKLASEKLIDVFTKNTDIEYTIFRPFSVYGPGQNMHNMKQGMLSIYISYLLRGLPVIVKGSLERFRDFIYIDDVVEALLKSENCAAAYGEIFNLGTGIKTTVRQLLEGILRIYNKNDFDKWVRVEGYTQGDTAGFVADMNKFYKIFDFKSQYRVEDGLLKMKEWLDKTADLWVGQTPVSNLRG